MLGLLEPGHLLLILLGGLLVFGPRKLPELGKSLGETLREFRRHTAAVDDVQTPNPATPTGALAVAAPVSVLSPAEPADADTTHS